MISKKHFAFTLDGKPTSESYCATPELIENYELAINDGNMIWDCHHKLETHNSDGEARLVELTSDELIALGTYFKRPPEELIFLKRTDHRHLHHHKQTEEHKAKLSKLYKGRKFSKEHKRKLSEVKLGKHIKIIDGKRKWY